MARKLSGSPRCQADLTSFNGRQNGKTWGENLAIYQEIKFPAGIVLHTRLFFIELKGVQFVKRAVQNLKSQRRSSLVYVMKQK